MLPQYGQRIVGLLPSLVFSRLTHAVVYHNDLLTMTFVIDKNMPFRTPHTLHHHCILPSVTKNDVSFSLSSNVRYDPIIGAIIRSKDVVCRISRLTVPKPARSICQRMVARCMFRSRTW